MPDTPSTAVNPPKQPRSRKTLERLVNAALELLEAKGPDGVTVHAVVARANSSVGSFYARFGGKDDLLEYLQERVWDEALTRWNAAVETRAWSDMALPAIGEGAVGLLIDVRRSRVGRLQKLDRMSGGGNAYERFRRHLVKSLEGLLLDRRTEMEHPRPELAVRLGLSAVMGVIDAGLDAPSDGEGPLDLSREQLVEECTDLLLGYLGGAEGRGKEPVEFFDVWG
ncbi:MAG: TetR/AcrR family transcriptional regulator [Gemmatimonadota bacterium]|nr:TetR/AcrR family transcriptional regulator [Gemmatimonadota bacterium]MDH3422227.1 TetR/AcrR family transcriptional regulator [Gemmatimonadota bacterium]